MPTPPINEDPRQSAIEGIIEIYSGYFPSDNVERVREKLSQPESAKEPILKLIGRLKELMQRDNKGVSSKGQWTSRLRGMMDPRGKIEIDGIPRDLGGLVKGY